MNTSWRERTLEFGRVNTQWLGELMLVYAPVAIIGLMVLATMSFVLGDGIATNQRFELAWAWSSALSVDGVMLALIVRAAKPSKSWRYGVTLVTLAPMIVVGIALLALVTMQQTLQITSEQLAIHMLGIDPVVLVIGRACLTMFAALVGLVFSHLRPSIDRVDRPVDRVDHTIDRIDQVESTPLPLEIPEAAQSIDQVGRSTAYESIKSIMVDHLVDGRLAIGLQSIADKSSVSLGTVKKYSPQIKRELGLVS